MMASTQIHQALSIVGKLMLSTDIKTSFILISLYTLSLFTWEDSWVYQGGERAPLDFALGPPFFRYTSDFVSG